LLGLKTPTDIHAPEITAFGGSDPLMSSLDALVTSMSKMKTTSHFFASQVKYIFTKRRYFCNRPC